MLINFFDNSIDLKFAALIAIVLEGYFDVGGGVVLTKDRGTISMEGLYMDALRCTDLNSVYCTLT